MSKKQIALKIILPLLILGIGVGILLLMVKSRQAPARQEAPYRGVLVRTLAAERGPQPIQVRATGTVQPRQQSDIVPQVSGLVTEVGANLVAGGFVQAGELLFALEKVDFELAVEQARANLVKAQLEAETVAAQAEIARNEWQRLHPDEVPSPLVVYEPQLKSAAAVVASARAGLQQAELNLKRTRVTAPFNGYLRSETVDLGQYLRSGNPVATLVGTDQAEIILPLPLQELPWLQVPRQTGHQGSAATVSLPAAGQRKWHGWIDRSLGEVDSQGRMARVAVLVADPYGLKEQTPLPLAVGSFVDVVLQGRSLDQVVALPRLALRDDDTVWIMGDDQKLQIVPVEVVRREKDVVLISQGLKGGEAVVVTPISGAAEGLLLRQAD